MKIRIIKIFVVVWILCIATGCTKISLDLRPAEKMRGEVSFPVDWEESVSASGLRFYFYPFSGGVPLVRDCAATGFNDTLPIGEYRVLAINADLAGVSVEKMERYETAILKALPVATRAGIGLSMIEQPEDVWCLQFNKVTVQSGGTVVNRLVPKPLVHTARLSFSISNRNSLLSLEGSIQGAYPSVMLSTRRPSPEALAAAAVTLVPFEVTLTGDGGKCEVRMLGLLHSDNGKIYRNILRLTAVATNGQTLSTEVDLTDDLSLVMDANGGMMPEELSILLSVDIIPGAEFSIHATAVVQSWGNGGDANGDLWQ